jgi:hypothetical protein
MKTFDEIREYWMAQGLSHLGEDDIGWTSEEEECWGYPEVAGNDEMGWIGWLYHGDCEDSHYVGPYASRDEAVAALRDSSKDYLQEMKNEKAKEQHVEEQ